MSSYGVTRQQALALVHEHIQNQNLVNHCLAAEAVMRAAAKRLGEDQDQWGLAGLLHDLDAETHPDLAVHTSEAAATLKKMGIDAEIVDAVRLHNLAAWPGEKRITPFHHALAAGETITGLIIAAALVNPAKQLAAVKPKSVKKRFKEKAFARGADREIIAECELAGIPLPEFCELSLAAMQTVAKDIGL